MLLLLLLLCTLLAPRQISHVNEDNKAIVYRVQQHKVFWR